MADRLFSERGYHDVKLDEIADEASISKPGLYAYFGSKENLYAEGLRRAADMLGERIAEAAAAARDPEERMWLGILAFLGFVDERRDRFALLYRESSAGSGPFAEEVARARGHLADVVGQIFRDVAAGAGMGAGAIDAIEPQGYAFAGAADGIARWWMDHPDVPRGTVAMYLMNACWQGYGDLAAGRTWIPRAGW